MWHYFFVNFTKASDSINRGKIKHIFLLYILSKETVVSIMMSYKNTKGKVFSPDGKTDYFDIVASEPPGDTLAPYLFIICLDDVLWTSIDFMKENGFTLAKTKSKRYPARTITTEYKCFNQRGDISTLNDGSLKLVDMFTYQHATSKGMSSFG